MFRSLLAHPQDALQNDFCILRACYVSWVYHDWSGTPLLNLTSKLAIKRTEIIKRSLKEIVMVVLMGVKFSENGE
jgi:hypothetical protein